jgi:hypothetical protein
MRHLGLVAILLLVGCAGEQVKSLSSQRADSSYRKLVMNFGTGTARPGQISYTASDQVSIYLKLFDSNGALAICGYYVLPDLGGLKGTLVPAWMAQAGFYADEVRIAPTSFLYARRPKSDEFDAEATCVETTLPFASVRATTRLTIAGGEVRE